MQIIKRDGRIVDFKRSKIEKAILKAFIAVDGAANDYALSKAENIADYIEEICEKNKTLTVEEIQDLVEKGLMSTKRKDVAKAYITYRYERTKERDKNSALMKSVTKKLNASEVQNQNANVDEKSFGGRMGEVNSAIMKQYALDYCMSEMARNNHLNNEIYIHDLDHYAVGDHNCLSIPFDDLLAKGFNTRQTDVRPANSVNTAFQLVAVIFQLQSLQQFGGVSATHLDWTMVPYVRKSFWKHFLTGIKYFCSEDEVAHLKETIIKADYAKLPIEGYSVATLVKNTYSEAYEYAMDMTIKEIQQAVEGMYHNLNTLQSRSGN